MKILKSVLVAVALIAGGSFAANAQNPLQGGVGPVISGSVDSAQLPEAAKTFIKKHYPNRTIDEVDKVFISGDYEVELSDGTELEFNSKGKVIEVEAPRHAVVEPVVIEEIITPKAYKELENREFTGNVESVKTTSKHQKVELRGYEYDTVIFDLDGNLIAITD